MRQPTRAREIRYDAETPELRVLGNYFYTAVEEGDIAAKLVNDETAGQRRLRLAHQGPGTDKTSDDTAPLDIGDQDYRDTCRFGETHVCDVASAQVNFSRATCTLDQDQISVSAQKGKAL